MSKNGDGLNRFWLTFDLGVQGDYGPLYRWLDDVGAEECGDSAATFRIEGTREQVATAIVKATKRQGRLYLIGKNRTGRFVGGFVSGRRKAPYWTGMAEREEEGEEEG